MELELVMATTQDETIFTSWDYDNNAEIMHSINSLRRNKDESEIKTESQQKLKMEAHTKTNFG